MFQRRSLLLCVLLLGLSSVAVGAAPLRLAIQPILPAAQTRAAYQPLADYLGQVIGREVRIVTSPNFLAYWETMRRRGAFDLALDAAHFTDYRDEHMGFTVLVKLPDTVSYSIVTAGDRLLFDPGELIGQPVATLTSPSLGAVRLAQMFPNPLRQPVIVKADDSVAAIRMVLAGKVMAAIVPTPLLNQYSNLNVVTTTPPVPHIALSAAPSVDAATQRAIREAMLNAGKTEAGRRMLTAVKLPGFVAADNRTYHGYAQLLQGVWGY